MKSRGLRFRLVRCVLGGLRLSVSGEIFGLLLRFGSEWLCPYFSGFFG